MTDKSKRDSLSRLSKAEVAESEDLNIPIKDTDDGEQPQSDVPEELPILPLRGLVVYPQTAIPFTVGQPRSMKLVDDVVAGSRLIGLVTAKNPELETPGPDDVYEVGTLASIHRLFRVPDGTIRLLVQGLARIKIDDYTSLDPYLRAKVHAIPKSLRIRSKSKR